MTNAREGDDQALYHAGLARQQFDYISQELSPYATIVAREHYSTDALRLGRLKSVINMVVWYQNYLRKNYIKRPFLKYVSKIIIIMFLNVNTQKILYLDLMTNPRQKPRKTIITILKLKF